MNTDPEKKAQKNAVILNGVPQWEGGCGTQLKDPVELAATAISVLFTSLAAEFRS